MSKINFYGVDATFNINFTLFKVLIKLLEKAIENNKNSLVFSHSTIFLKEIDDILWCNANWLPHALVMDPYNTKQPILLTNKLINDNKSSYLFILDNTEFTPVPGIEKICFIFNINSIEDINTFNLRWKDLQKSGFDLQYFKQDKQGRFQNAEPL